MGKLNTFQAVMPSELDYEAISRKLGADQAAQLGEVALDLMNTGSKIDAIGWMSEANYIDIGMPYEGAEYISLINGDDKYVTGNDAKIALCSNAARSQASDAKQESDTVILTHLAIEVQDTGLVEATYEAALRDLVINIKAPANVENREIVQGAVLKHWLVPDLRQASTGMAAIPSDGTATTVGRHVFDLFRYGQWEYGMRKLPRPILVKVNQAAELLIENPGDASPEGSSPAMAVKVLARMHRLRGVANA